MDNRGSHSSRAVMWSCWDVWKVRSTHCVFCFRCLRYPQYRTDLTGHTPWHIERHPSHKKSPDFLPTPSWWLTLPPFPSLKQTVSQFPPVSPMPIDWAILTLVPWLCTQFLRWSVALWKRKPQACIWNPKLLLTDGHWSVKSGFILTCLFISLHLKRQEH